MTRYEVRAPKTLKPWPVSPGRAAENWRAIHGKCQSRRSRPHENTRVRADKQGNARPPKLRTLEFTAGGRDVMPGLSGT